MSAASPTQTSAGGATRPSSLLIRDCAFLAPASQEGLLLHQDILVSGTRIAAIGPTGTLAGGTSALQIVPGEGRLAIPGLVNAHTHSPENILKATSPSLPLELWLIPLFSSSVQWSPRLTYLSTLLGAAEMLKTGTTAVLDHLWTVEGVAWEYLDAAMCAYRDAGIRVGVAPSIEDQDLVLDAGTRAGVQFPSHPFTNRFTQWPTIEAQLANLERFLATWHNSADGRLRCLPGPSAWSWRNASTQACISTLWKQPSRRMFSARF
jgi:5-methylthioadenosine/S-adenosylhomocysteine deaminase